MTEPPNEGRPATVLPFRRPGPKVLPNGDVIPPKDQTAVEFLEGLLAEIKAGDYTPKKLAVILIEDVTEKGVTLEHSLPRFHNMSFIESIGYLELIKHDVMAGT